MRFGRPVLTGFLIGIVAAFVLALLWPRRRERNSARAERLRLDRSPERTNRAIDSGIASGIDSAIGRVGAEPAEGGTSS